MEKKERGGMIFVAEKKIGPMKDRVRAMGDYFQLRQREGPCDINCGHAREGRTAEDCEERAWNL